MLKTTILVDNIADGSLLSEWGFCAHIEYKGKKYLLDTGASDRYAANARELDIRLSEVDTAVLSHAHFDHSGGYRGFFRANQTAKLFLSDNCSENCFFKLGPVRKYIGIPKKLLADCEERLEYVDGFRELDEGVYLVPHLENGLEQIGKKAHLYARADKRLSPDNFCHEQSLVFDTPEGLVVFNSCSHGGLQNILADIGHFLPGKSIYMTVGGLHLSSYGKDEVRRIAGILKGLGIKRIVTGHCTGDKAFAILREELGDGVEQTRVGLVVEV